MRRAALACASFLLLVSRSDGRKAPPPLQEQTPEIHIPQDITAEQAASLELDLKKNPDDFAAREKLLDYYFRAQLNSRTPEIEQKREQSILWVIEHHPDSVLAGSPEAEIAAIGFDGSAEGYVRAKQLWLEQTDKHRDNPKILVNAAQFLIFADATTARALLEKAWTLRPGDPGIASHLAQSYDFERERTTSAEEKSALAQKALEIRERGADKADAAEKFNDLGDLAKAALDAGDVGKAQQYATELLQSAPQHKGDWNYGNAIFTGNTVLGRIALRRGDIAEAKQRLQAAGETPGSPQLGSFGPNMALAKELLEKGEREAVLSFFDACAKFWQMGGEELKSWTATVKGGGIPDFRANLDY